MDAYIVVSSDYHSSEYVGDFFKAREYMSGFTGSAGTLVVTKSEALLWTDGRYFLQAEDQLKNTCIKLMKQGEKGVLTIAQYLFEVLDFNAVVGFDGKTVSNSFVNNLDDLLEAKCISYAYDKDLVGEIWNNRPALSCEKVWALDVKYSGKTVEEKLAKLRSEMQGNVIVLSALDEIAWLLNLRGNDVECTPVFLSYMLVEMDCATLFVNPKIISDEINNILSNAGVKLAEYDSFYDVLSSIDYTKIVQLDYSSVNYYATNCIGEDVCVKDVESPIILQKAVKNNVEIANIRKAHIMDGVALCKFIYWLKNSSNITELDAVEKLKKLRSENASYVEESFDAIVAYGPHGAIVHYEPTDATNATIERKSLCLVDTGGHYLEGSTDVTRTIAMGELTYEEIKDFTVVLKGNLALANARFPYGVFGENLDSIARKPLWEYSLDYNHGTGHGVGYLLSVHEGPQNISWHSAKRKSHYPISPGMITSNEPGYYKAGEFGIRHENLILAQSDENDYVSFEVLTLAPFDLEAMDINLLSAEEIAQLNAYHRKVREAISPYLSGDELAWLIDATREI